MLSANEIVEVNQAQRTYARLAGILMLGAILVAIGGGAILSNIAGSGDFEQHAPCLRALCDVEASQQSAGPARNDLHVGRLIPGPYCADVQLREVASLYFCDRRRSRIDPRRAVVRPDTNYCGYY